MQQERFQVSGTFTVPAGVTRLYFSGTAAGGGGGGGGGGGYYGNSTVGTFMGGSGGQGGPGLAIFEW